ncbi:MAG: hypothetical protein KatS3mg085_654 [Candidatus Dojkabacteria bacterium]|nr:MAG: hypothetical protein KatS3mg085_654 [Candidatus Dojkabacteria bacterium]
MNLNDNLVYIVLGLIILVLVIVIIFQGLKIKKLQRPRYGFLGKTLALAVALTMLGSSLGLGYYLNNYDQGTEGISADSKVELSISYTKISPTEYSFSALPIVDGFAWGNNESLTFDIFWEVENNQKIKNFVETNISQYSPSKITLKLDKGVNTITAKIYIKSRVVSESVTITIR